MYQAPVHHKKLGHAPSISNGANLAPHLIKIDFAVFPAANLYFLYCLTAK